MIDSNGYLKIIDFGVAKAVVQTEMTAPGLFKGKLTHVAPEIFTKNSIDHRADIYSLGLVLFEMITGERPYRFDNSAVLVDTIKRIVEEPITRPSQINKNLPRELDDVILQACEKKREARFQSAQEFQHALAEIVHSSTLGIGIVSNTDVKTWLNGHFEERLTQRRLVEKQAIEKAKREFEEISIMPPPVPPTTSRKRHSGSIVVTADDYLHNRTPSDSGWGTGISLSARMDTQSQTSRTPKPQYGSSPTSAPQSFPMSNVNHGAENASGNNHKNLYYHSSAPPPSMNSMLIDDTPGESRVSSHLYFFLVAAATTVLSVTVFIVVFFLWKEEPEESYPGDDGRQPETNSSLQKIAAVTFTTQREEQTTKEQQALSSEPPSSSSSTEIEQSDSFQDKPIELTKEREILSTVFPRRKKSWSKFRRTNRIDDEDALENTTSDVATDEGDPPGDVHLLADYTDDPDTEEKDSRKRRDRSSSSKVTQPKINATATRAPRATQTRPLSSTKMLREFSSKWLSGTGNWDGATAVHKGCSSCHQRPEATSKTSSQWEYFFSRNRHRRHGDLRKLFSTEELRRVQFYLRSKSKGKNKSSGIAGVR
jgi:hypothetical protein